LMFAEADLACATLRRCVLTGLCHTFTLSLFLVEVLLG